MKNGPILAVATFLLVLVSGCAGGNANNALNPNQPGGLGGSDEMRIQGIVIDEELLPVEGALVKVKDLPQTATTDAGGLFSIGPVVESTYEVTVEKAGYRTVTQTVFIAAGSPVQLQFSLVAVASNVPYHETTSHVTFVQCASYNPVGGVPCTKLVDYMAGTNVSPEESFAFSFVVPYDGLADLLIEGIWEAQAFGRDMLFMVQTPPNQPATALSVKYFTMEGGSPIKGWVVANIDNDGEDGRWELFDATANKVTYEMMTVWSDGNSTIPGVPGALSGTTLYLNHRAEVWMTYFYNRAGPREYSALPDQ